MHDHDNGDETEAMINAILHQLPVSRDVAAALAEAAKPLWTLLEQQGMADSYGGCESQRVLPAALAFIHSSTLCGPEWQAPPTNPAGRLGLGGEAAETRRTI